MKTILTLAGLLIGAVMPAGAQAPERITFAIDVRTEGRPTRDETAARAEADIRVGLEAIPGAVLVPPERAGRIVWVIVGSGPSDAKSASVVVTERYDQTTLKNLGIIEAHITERMMAQRIVINHELFTGRDLQGMAKRIVEWVNHEIFEPLRPPKQP